MAYDKNEYNRKYYKEHTQECKARRKAYGQTKLKRVPLDVQNDWYDVLKECCEVNGNIPVNKFIKEACEQIAKQTYGFNGFEEYHEGKKKRDKIESVECDNAESITHDNIENIAHDNDESITPETTQAMSDGSTEPATTPESEVPNEVQPSPPVYWINYLKP